AVTVPTGPTSGSTWSVRWSAWCWPGCCTRCTAARRRRRPSPDRVRSPAAGADSRHRRLSYPGPGHLGGRGPARVRHRLGDRPAAPAAPVRPTGTPPPFPHGYGPTVLPACATARPPVRLRGGCGLERRRGRLWKRRLEGGRDQVHAVVGHG